MVDLRPRPAEARLDHGRAAVAAEAVATLAAFDGPAALLVQR